MNKVHCIKCKRNTAPYVCGKCGVVSYCGTECANADWPYHRIAEHSEWHSNPVDMILGPGDDGVKGSLWLGGIESLSHLRKHNIGAVVTIMAKDDRLEEHRIRAMVGWRPHLFFGMHDDAGEPIGKLFRESTRFIARLLCSKNVLVHCRAGISRSVTLCVAYMMMARRTNPITRQPFDVDGALEYINMNRPGVNPNKGFMRALYKKQKALIEHPWRTPVCKKNK